MTPRARSVAHTAVVVRDVVAALGADVQVEKVTRTADMLGDLI